MKKHKLTLLIITMLVFLLCSCSQNSPVLPSDMALSGTWEDLFKGLWTGLSDNYVFWDLDDANGEWDKVYEEFIPKFRELGSINTSDREATKKGTILLFDSVKNLSDGHFTMDAFGYSFSPSEYRILKKEHPELSDQEVLEIIYKYYDKFDLLPADMVYEDSKSIMENTFSIPLTTTLEQTADYIDDYSSLYFQWNESGTCNALNPEIQLRTPAYGEAIMLYSSSHKFGSVTTYDGEVLDFTSDDAEAYKHPEVSFPGKAIYSYGPYYPVSDLSWEGKEQKLDSLFSDWTLCLVLSVSPEYDQTGYKKGVNLKMLALSGITKETDGSAINVDYTANTVYFISSGFNFLPMKDQAEMKQFLMDFHKFKMNENAAGMILDMRGNSGGYNADREILFGDMFREPHLIGYQKNKTGAGRLDLTQEFPLYIYPEADFFGNEFSDIASKPVVVITNTATASNGEITVFMVKSLPNGGQTGGVTIGANGTLAGDILTYNSGKFSVGNYITSVYTPYGNIRDTNHVSYEGKGLTPDKGYEENFNFDDFFDEGKDSRLGKAFEWIKDHR